MLRHSGETDKRRQVDPSKEGKKMTLREITAQRMAIKLCVALRKSPTETVKMLEVADNMSKVSRAFVY